MKKKHILSIYFIASFFIVLILSFAPFYVAEIQVKNVKVDELMQDESSLVDFQNQLLGQRFRIVLGDLHYLHHVYGDVLFRGDENNDKIAKDWVEFSNQRRIYDQIRYIDKHGDESIRINMSDNKEASLVDKSQLQNKGDRYYFTETQVLKNEAVFVSPLDLNIEGDTIEEPFKPVIRFSTPIYDENEEFQGLIILNYLGNTALNDFRELAKNSNGRLALLNIDSYWLSCEDSENEWNFMFEDKKDEMFAQLFPDEWKIIKESTNTKEQMITSNGLFTFAPVHLNHNYVKGSSYEIDENINYTNAKWYIVSVVNPENELAPYFLNNRMLLIKDVFKNNYLQFLLMVVISLIISFLVYLNRKKYYEIKFFSEYDPLTKTFNRRAGYTKIQQLIFKNEKRDVAFSLCFLDVNGLKQVNDYLGHEFGDELLLTVCDTIKRNIRDNDFLIRQGGDEFILILNGMGLAEAENTWKRIAAQFDELNKKSGSPYIVSVSHGIVEYNNKNKMVLDDLIQLADEKMYAEKEVMKKDFTVFKSP